MKKNGFTLVELLATIIIIAMLVAIVSISADIVVRNYKTDLSQSQIDIIEEAANIYYLKEGIKNSYNNRSFKLCVNLSYLIENDYLEGEEVINPKNNEKLEGSVEITQKSDQLTYKYKEKNCTYEYQAIDEICRAVTNETKTTGNIPTGKYLLGDEYICEVKNNIKYHFFVVGTETNNVNLIMERNIAYDNTNDIGVVATSSSANVEWISKLDYGCVNDENCYIKNDKGPITAMKYLHNATKDWHNIPNIIMNYEDENIDSSTLQKGTEGHGYGGIKTTQNITIITSKNGEETLRLENLKARMPKYSEVTGEGRCTTNSGSCPLWLANYGEFSSDYDKTEEERIEIKGIKGIWVLSSDGRYDNSLWAMDFGDGTSMNDYGVRPVISIPKLDIAN